MSDRHLAARRLLVVTEEELQRIVLDIHDGPVQNIFAALSQLEHVRGRLTRTKGVPEDCTGPLALAIGLLEVSLNEIRGLMSTFRARHEEDHGTEKESGAPEELTSPGARRYTSSLPSLIPSKRIVER